tara:strand:+ start:1281 stop:2204 length:924 start_codon:yes stop_codon:yes gene_type:complete
MFFGISIITKSLIDISSFGENRNYYTTASISSKTYNNENNSKNYNLNENYLNFKKKITLKKKNILKLDDLNNFSQNDSTSIFDNNVEKLNKFSKKEKFINEILPIIIQVNTKLRNDRLKLINIKNRLILHKTLDKKDQDYIIKIAKSYNIDYKNKHKIDIIEKLLKSVDEIPTSLVLAQAANESGWGTSRFAREYNALFGQYTFDHNSGVVPIYRDVGENYLIKFFPNVNDSVESYFKNINTHNAYKEFRLERNNLRNKNLPLDSLKLVNYLKPYAKDKNYIKTIKSIINSNYLIKFDNLKTITTSS